MIAFISRTGLSVFFILLCARFSLHAQEYKPAIEFASLMNMRFYEANGGFYVDDLQLVFPPPDGQRMWLVITTETGKVVTSKELTREPWHFPMFDGLIAKGEKVLQPGKPGKYNMVVTVGKTPITIMPFTLNVTSNGDPFNLQKTFTRDGLWHALAYFSKEANRPNGTLSFNWWSSLREFGKTSGRVSCTARLMKGDQVIAEAPKVVVSSLNWQFFSRRLVQRRNHGRKNVTLALLTAEDGEYRMVLNIDGKAAKSYTVVVKNGQLQPLPFCDLIYEPHTNFISPRIIDTSSGSGSSYKMLDAYWVKWVKK